MLRIIVQIVPADDETRVEEVAHIEVINVGEMLDGRHGYRVRNTAVYFAHHRNDDARTSVLAGHEKP